MSSEVMNYEMNIFQNSMDEFPIERRFVLDSELEQAISYCVTKGYAYEINEIASEADYWKKKYDHLKLEYDLLSSEYNKLIVEKQEVIARSSK